MRINNVLMKYKQKHKQGEIMYYIYIFFVLLLHFFILTLFLVTFKCDMCIFVIFKYTCASLKYYVWQLLLSYINVWNSSPSNIYVWHLFLSNICLWHLLLGYEIFIVNSLAEEFFLFWTLWSKNFFLMNPVTEEYF